MHAIVVGGDSSIGQALRRALVARDHLVVRTTRRPLETKSIPGEWRVAHLDMLDVSKFHKILGSVEGDAGVVYIMAAITGVVPAERHPDAWRINAEAPVSIARQAAARGWHVVQMSSGTVELAPHTASALQKSYADLAVTLLGGCVVRPLPRVPEEKYAELASLLVKLGEERHVGTVRWE